MHVHKDMYIHHLFKTAGHLLKDRKHFPLSQHHKSARVRQVIPDAFKTSMTAMPQLHFKYETPWYSPFW